MAKEKSRGLTFDEISAQIQNKKFSPIYLLFGEEQLLVDEIVDDLVTNAIDESTKSFNLDVVYGSDVTGQGILAMATSFPMMAEKRVVVVRDFDKVNGKDILISYIERPCPSTSLVLVSAKPDYRIKIYKMLREVAVVGEFRQLFENTIPAWIAKRAQKLGKTITSEAAHLVMTYVGRSLRDIQNELEKLCIYVGEKRVIEVNDVEEVVGFSRQYNIFELQRAIGQRQLPRALRIVENMLRSGESPIGIIVMLTRYFHKLWLLVELFAKKESEYQLAARIAVSPGYIKEYIDASRRYSSAHLESCFFRLTEADEMLKSSVMDYHTTIIVLLHHLIREDSSTSSAEYER